MTVQNGLFEGRFKPLFLQRLFLFADRRSGNDAGGKLRRRGGIFVWSPGASESFGQEIISEEDIHAGIVLPESKAPEIGGTSSSWHRL